MGEWGRGKGPSRDSFIAKTAKGRFFAQSTQIVCLWPTSGSPFNTLDRRRRPGPDMQMIRTSFRSRWTNEIGLQPTHNLACYLCFAFRVAILCPFNWRAEEATRSLEPFIKLPGGAEWKFNKSTLDDWRNSPLPSKGMHFIRSNPDHPVFWLTFRLSV